MKKIIISTMLLAFVTVSFGQQTAPKQDWKESDYYKKSKKQKTVAWILVGGGTALFVGGLISHFNYLNSGEASVPEYVGLTDGMTVAVAGVVVGCGSIPFFISSSKNKRKAKETSVFIDMETAPALQGTVFSNQSFPAVGVRIRL